jgi:hypothetical protein
MKLQIEIWVLEKGYTNNIRKLFNESVICYRNGAYRASLIFSYIGFLTIIKETIVKAQRPTAFTESEWNNLISKINNDDLWEKEVYESLIRATKPIFPLNEDLKLQLRYWKDRRNDCAHFKYNEIENHHTEAFWSFIKSNVPKMTVEGGMETLLNKFDEHFDDTKTPPNADFTHLVKEIETSVLTIELHDFFKKLKARIDGRRWWYPDSDALKVYYKILDVADTRTQESLIEYLKQEDRDVKFLNAYPDKIIQLNFSPAEIRTLWKTRIYDKTSTVNPYNIFAGLLRHSLIPKDQIEDANTEIFGHYSQTDYHKLPESKDIETLKANNFFETVFKIAIIDKDLKDFMWVNSKCDLIISFIENLPVNIKTVKCVFEMAERANPSQWLVRELKNTFTNLPDLKTQFHTIATTNSIKIPADFR